MPTIIEVSGATYPKRFHNGDIINPLAGKSLVDVITKKAQLKREYLFWEHQDFCAIRKGDFKAVKKISDTEWQLFNLKNDRTERIDIAKKNPELINELNEKWNEWAIENNVIPKKLK